MQAENRLAHLRTGGTSVVVDLGESSFPCVLHWGPDLGAMEPAQLQDLARAVTSKVGDSAIYTQNRVSLLPQRTSGWLGRPGVAVGRAGHSWRGDFASVEHSIDEAGGDSWPDGSAGASRVRSVGVDGGLEVGTELELHPSGLLRLRARVRNLTTDTWEVSALEPALPVPAEAEELLDMSGRHTRERVPQRRGFDVGAWVREARGGRPGHESPTVLCAGRAGFAFRSGRVWGVHLAWSGNQVLTAERDPTGWRLLRGGELLLPGEVLLGSGDTYESPWLVASWGEGLDALSHRFHDYLRARPSHPRTPRPVLLNTWEAVYFDQELEKLQALADRAAAVGVERFVLDDGWFLGRRDDTRGLGDWYVDPAVWPSGLQPLVDHVRGLGMQFGLWFEPEMVNLDSRLARDHPDWLLSDGEGPGLPSRYQHVLDLGQPGAYAYILERVSELTETYALDYIKWDHNRPLLDPVHQATGTPGISRHTAALYRLIDELKARFPSLEIESCAGGGARIDLGILARTDRIWGSDCNDAHDRQGIQRWTSLLLAPELVGTHIGSTVDHTTGRTHSLGFRGLTALWGHLGIEWDLTAQSGAALDELRTWVERHKRLRALLHSGRVVHADLADPALRVEGVVSEDGRQGIYEVVALDRTASLPPGRVVFPGLLADAVYAVSQEAASSAELDGWLDGGLRLSGRALANVGIASPALRPDSGVLVSMVAEG